MSRSGAGGRRRARAGERSGGPEGDRDPGSWLSAVFESAAMGIALVDMAGHPVRSNPALQRMLGYGAEELAGMAFTEFTHPEDAEADWDLFQQLIEGARDHYQMHKRYLRKDGRVIWGRLTVSLVRARDGTPRYAVGMVEDATAQKEAELRRTESEALLRAVVESEPECVKLVDPEGRILMMNPAGLRIVEAEAAAQVEGRSVYDLVAPEHQGAVRSLVAATLRGEEGTLGFDVIGLNGTRRSMESHAVPFRDVAGRIVGCLSITRDVTERNRTRAELSRTRNDLLKILSHELFTPLTVIQGAGLTMVEHGDALDLDDRRDLLAGVERASQRLRRLVANLAAAARLEGDPIALTAERVLVTELVSRAVRLFPSESARFDVRIPEDPPELVVDLELATTALATVLENALDLSEGPVEVEAGERSGWATLTVSDHGPGVPEDHLASIFEPFTQVDPGLTRSHEGLGIGLYLARRVMEAHRGRIAAVSRPGYGAVFELSFPAPEANAA